MSPVHLLLATLLPSSVPVERLDVPDGFEVTVFATEVENARAMALSGDGVLYVGSRKPGKVHAVIDRDNDGTADEVRLVDQGLRLPSGLVWHEGALYVAAVDRILRYDGLTRESTDPVDPVVLVDDLPIEHHGWKYLELGPDNKLYFGIGAPCNICNEAGFATIERVDLDGNNRQTVALGVRNTVGLAFHPKTGELWFTDNGRDMLGDDLPPDELNRLTDIGSHFGYPYCHGGFVVDPEFGIEQGCEGFVPPVQALGAHVAPLGLTFYDHDAFPSEYRGQLFIAEHGSWNRSKKVGYRVTRIRLEGGQAVEYEPFVTGWLEGQDNWGRPADVFLHPDGSLLISDDQGGVIYRVRYVGQSAADSAGE